MRILICGAGIAGPTLAYWLARYGMMPTIIEKAPALRTGGYVVDFWGVGFEVARRMGVLPRLLRHGYTMREVRVVNAHGGRVTGFPAAAFARAVRSGFTSVRRADLASTIVQALPGNVTTVFGDTIDRIDQMPDGVQVRFGRSGAQKFDLVIGADGLHSRVRELTFGPETDFEHYLGVKVAAFEVDGYQPRDELVYVMYTELRQQVARFAMRDGRTMFLFTFADDNPAGPSDITGQKELLRERFGRSGWECPRILERLEEVRELYFDRVSQIEMTDGWTKGRVALVGDAAFCVSLLGGQGSALAMAAAYILAAELQRADGHYQKAFDQYQRVFGPFVHMKQRAARRFISTFAPPSRLSLFLRNQVFRLLSIGWIADLTAGREFSDAIALPDS